MVIILVFGYHSIISYSQHLYSGLSSPYNNTSRGIVGVINNIRTIRSLYDENNDLKEKNVQLLQETTSLKLLREENKELKSLLEYYENNSNDNYITAAVFAQDPLNLSNIVSIDKGTKNKVNINNHVVYNGMYLGQVIESNNFTSKVRLISDPKLTIIGHIPDINVNAIVHGQIGYGLTIEDIPPDANLEIGQIVTTSSIDITMPDNLLLGEISEINQSDQEIFQQATITPYFNAINLKYVLVYLNE